MADKITAYHAYVAAHKQLFEANTRRKIFIAARDVVENYLENQSIYSELNYYKEHGEILGKHPIFSRLNRLDQLRGMKIGELVTLKIRLTNNLIRNRKKIRDEPGHVQSQNRIERIKLMELELTEVNRLLNIDEKQVLLNF